jgi:nucleoside-diphosphate-sugar epimerase
VALAAGGILETFHNVLALRGEPRLTRFVVREMATAHWFDISAARRDFGYQPQVSFDEGLVHLAEWFRQDGLTC